MITVIIKTTIAFSESTSIGYYGWDMEPVYVYIRWSEVKTFIYIRKFVQQVDYLYWLLLNKYSN